MYCQVSTLPENVKNCVLIYAQFFANIKEAFYSNFLLKCKIIQTIQLTFFLYSYVNNLSIVCCYMLKANNSNTEFAIVTIPLTNQREMLKLRSFDERRTLQKKNSLETSFVNSLKIHRKYSIIVYHVFPEAIEFLRYSSCYYRLCVD